jgi:putative nucleotidyltransferase with HDIG domain
MAVLVSSPVRIGEVISALSFALDLTEGLPLGHSVRSCVLGMRLADEIELPRQLRGDLYYALLMKDAGCSANASRVFQLLGGDDIGAKRDAKTTDWARRGWESLQYALSHVRVGAPFLERARALFSLTIHQKRNARELASIRCERGAAIARRIGLSETVAQAIHDMNELWDGSGQPGGLSRLEIPLLSRIINLAQTVEVYYTKYGVEAAVDMVKRRSGRWFAPSLARAFCLLAKNMSVWEDVENAQQRVIAVQPPEHAPAGDESADEEHLDNICLAFADVIDAKSPFTYRHSAGVADTSLAIARTLGMPRSQVTLIRRAALLHDIGKLGLSNTILDKPDKLSAGEWESVRRHPYYSFEILRRVPGFGEVSDIAASHHEKLDGSGYYRNLGAAQLSLPARILAVADIYDALAARRPYRDALSQEKVFETMREAVPHALDPDCFEALKHASQI